MNRNDPYVRRWSHELPLRRRAFPLPGGSQPRPASPNRAPGVCPFDVAHPPEDNPFAGVAFALKLWLYVAAVALAWWAFGGAAAGVVGMLGLLVLAR